MTEPNDGNFANTRPGLSLSPLRAVRYAANGDSLRNLLSPPYDVIDAALRDELLAIDPHNAVALVLPNLGGDPDDPLPYHRAADRLRDWVRAGVLEVDPSPVLYVYEMTAPGGSVTRGLLGAIALRDYEDHVILPHENTMAGPVADRLALMTATEANLEPIYLVYDGGGAASDVVANAAGSPVVETTTPDGTTHRLWVIDDPQVHAAVDLDLSRRQGVIADGHHRYATYLALQRQLHAQRGPGPWDRGLTLLVDSSSYGPQVHAIHRVLSGVPFTEALESAARHGTIEIVAEPASGLAGIVDARGFAAVLSDGTRSAMFRLEDPAVTTGLLNDAEPAAMAGLDVTILHRGVIPRVWDVVDSEDNVRYAHDVAEAVDQAQALGGTAILLRPTPVAEVTAVARAGARMPRKSTLFTPKPASGLVMTRFADQLDD